MGLCARAGDRTVGGFAITPPAWCARISFSGSADGDISAKHAAGVGEVPCMNLGGARRIAFPHLVIGTEPIAEGNLQPTKASKAGGAFHNQDLLPRV